MAEYIDREAVIKAIEFNKGVGCSDRCVQGIKYIPAADVVEVVRCKDCKHRDNGMCFMHHDYGEIVYLDGYCNYAEEAQG